MFQVPGSFREKECARLVRLRLPTVALAAALLCALAVACIAPMRIPTRTRSVSGTEQKGKVELDFLQVATTTREEVEAKLGWLDAGVKGERLFVARWAESGWGVGYAVGGGGPGAAPAGEIGGGRLWGIHTLLVEFDESGVVTSSQVVSEDSLAKALSAWAAKSAGGEVDLYVPVRLTIYHRHFSDGAFPEAQLTLTHETLQFEETGEGKHNFVLPSQKLGRLAYVSYFARGVPDEPGVINHTLHLRERTKAGKKLTFRSDVPTLVTLVKYLAQTRARTKKKVTT